VIVLLVFSSQLPPDLAAWLRLLDRAREGSRFFLSSLLRGVENGQKPKPTGEAAFCSLLPTRRTT
jgi:hypothetical protein